MHEQGHRNKKGQGFMEERALIFLLMENNNRKCVGVGKEGMEEKCLEQIKF